MLCKKRFINSNFLKFGDWFQDQKGKTIIGTKWIFKIKLDEDTEVLRNKARLVANDYRQEEGIDFDGSFALVARI